VDEVSKQTYRLHSVSRSRERPRSGARDLVSFAKKQSQRSWNGRTAANRLRRSEASPVPTQRCPTKSAAKRDGDRTAVLVGRGRELEKGRLFIQNFQRVTHQVIENTGSVSKNGQNNPNSGTGGLIDHRIELSNYWPTSERTE